MSRTVHDLPDFDQKVVFGTLLAQVDDNHAGGVMGWDAREHDRAAELFEILQDPAASPLPPVQSSAIVKSLLYPVHDQDHPDLEDEEWDVAEQILETLAVRFGR